MPRLSIHHGPENDGWNENLDYCRRCYRAAVRRQPEADPENEHPDYSADEYSCEDCGKVLGNADN